MKNWQAWRTKFAGAWRRFVRHISPPAPEQSPTPPPPLDVPDSKKPPGAVPDVGKVTELERPAAKTPQPREIPQAPRVAPKVDIDALPAEPQAKWHSESMMAVGGHIDLAPWVLPVRTYRIYEPATLTADPCLLIVLHGCRQTAEDIAEGTRLNEHAAERGWLAVYPEQSITANKYGCWNWFDPANHRSAGECAIIVAIQDAVRARYGMEHAHTFLAGMSAGGALVSQLALLFPERWAAVAIHSGLPFGAATDPWGALRVMREGAESLAAARALKLASSAAPQIPALILHGDDDSVVHRRNAKLLVRQFLGWNGYFPDTADWEDAPLPRLDDLHVQTRYGHPYILRDYGQPGRVSVRECEVVGMGHAWSGGDSALPYHDELGPDASALMADFFAGIAAAVPDAGDRAQR